MAAPQLHQGQKPSSPTPASTNFAYFLPRSACCLLACAFLSLSLLHLLFCSPPGAQQAAVIAPLLQFFNHTYSSFSSRVGGVHVAQRERCDYSVGQWVWAPGHARRYNGTACSVGDGQDCTRNGRPDTDYLDWQWQPAAGCRLPAFDASAFLSAVRGKHVAFVGDSMARNQLESLLCLLAAASPYRLVGWDQIGRFRRWAFATHNVTVSVYWAPFLVRASGRSSANSSIPHDILHLDALDDRWSSDADTMDVAVINVGNWFWGQAVYQNGSEVIGTNLYKELNYTEIGMFRPFREAYRMALRRLSSGPRPRTVVAATFSPKHFGDKSYDDPTACAQKNPYKDGETELGSVDRELRSIVYEEMEQAMAKTKGSGVRFEVMDVTELALLRPDGHPGPYMRRDPFAHGVPERVSTDCLHFCLPGPVDTFNDILLQILMTKRR